jgi:FtsP/CotA-like multicopper oxidase with cupredoxin domain
MRGRGRDYPVVGRDPELGVFSAPSTARAGSSSSPETTSSIPTAWKDTVLVRAGETVDILLDLTNPGMWMAHCHIAEHNQSGMMFSFPVRES